ncbi:MAG: alternative ribosome rescue aminoacyl-tRNA hydrolase ArfB [Lutibacter sp.]|nr:alternative ribosome rescue aminoacyl-tRNA hydrolase ArfB [Lutibacter sp.]MDO9593788.1 alternative ribosome rescue aminoacyl-tRNA hydrolase ArfB [Lutibacter sp.]
MNTELMIKELKFKAVRSSGAGGQHVNKVSSKIELTFDLENSESFTEEEKALLIQKLKSKLTKDNVLLLQCDESRSQHKNKEIAIDRFLNIISGGLKVQKPRKETKPSKSSILKRLEKKKKTALKKVLRNKSNFE